MKIFIRLVLLSLLASLAGCGEDSDPTRNNDFVPLAGITVTSEFAQIPAEVANQFTATGEFGAFTRPITTEVAWSSSDPNILAFEDPSTGLARAITPGTVIVTAEMNGIRGTLDFTVNTATLTSITVVPEPSATEPVQIPQGETQRFAVRGNFSDSSVFPLSRSLQWASSDINVATVDEFGRATAKAAGPAEITATFTPAVGTPVSDSIQMTVTAPVVDSIRVTPANPLLTPTETQQFTATFILSDGTEQAVANAAWSSTNTGVATITSTGLATAVANGTTTITARDSASTLSGTTVLTVATVTEITFTPTDPTVSVGANLQLTATATLSNGTTQEITTLATWGTNRSDIALVGNESGNKGLVTGVAAGPATITATRSITRSITVNVSQP